MAAPSKSWTGILDSKIDADSPVLEELMTWIRDNIEHVDERIGIPVDSGDRQASHRHKGFGVDGTDLIDLTPQENLITSGDEPDDFTSTGDEVNDHLCFRTNNLSSTNYIISRLPAGPSRSKALHKAFVSANIIKKIKSAGGKGRFTCSMHMKRHADAAGVVGGTLRFGLWDGADFITGAFVDIDFDDVTTEYQRFYFISDQIERPAALNLRSEWVAHPSDWDTVNGDDEAGYHGGYMVTNGAGLAKWDISHFDGAVDSYDASENFYWWDEVITNVQKDV
jgi:hypothetical protein